MTVTISGKERDGLYERIVTRLNGIDDVYRAVEAEDWPTAQELGQEFSDLLQFVCADLGWGPRKAESFRLGSPPGVLSRVARVVRDLARVDGAHFEGEKRIAEAHELQARRLRETCERVLEELEAVAR
jgi:hypothetical protein